VHGACGLSRDEVLNRFERAARDTCDHYVQDVSAADGICYWDDGAPGLAKMPDWRNSSADPFNEHEPVDSSASAIAAQGLIRLGHVLGPAGTSYVQAGLSVAKTLFNVPYLSTNADHQGILLHSVYHRPNGWDFIPPGRKVPGGESSLWGDYHVLELAAIIQRLAKNATSFTFFDQPGSGTDPTP
jgi:hypothetical protein